MMKRVLLSACFLVSVLFANAQDAVRIVHEGDWELINGTTQTVSFPTDMLDHEVDFLIINDAGEDLAVNCRRIEVDVVPATRNNVCWLFCPAFPKVAGEVPDWLVSTNDTLTEYIELGDTATSFAFHYYPENTVGTSEFLVRFEADGNPDEVYAEFTLIYDHSANGIDELENNVSLNMAPNPANEFVNVNVENTTGQLDIKVYNVIGELMLQETILDSRGNIDIDTRDLENGIYMVSVLQGTDVMRTSRLVVRH